MQSDSDSDNEFFDAPEKLSLSGSFTADQSEQKEPRTKQKDIRTDGAQKDQPDGATSKDRSGVVNNSDVALLPATSLHEDKESTVKTCGEESTTSETTDDSLQKPESEKSLNKQFQLVGSKLSHLRTESVDVDTDQTCPTESKLSSGESTTDKSELPIAQDKGLSSDLRNNDRKSSGKADANEIIADVVGSIENESARPVAPPRRKKKKKLADKAAAETEVQTPMSSPSESPGPDSAVTTPTEQEPTSSVDPFKNASFCEDRSSKAKGLEFQASETFQEDPSIQVDANNKEMKKVLEKASSTEVISALNLDSRLKSCSVSSLGSTRSDSYVSISSNISNGIVEKAGSFTSVASTHSMKHENLLRYRSASGRPLSDIEILEQVMVKNLDTGEALPLSVAEEKLPKCTNPLALHLMRLTSEYSSNPELASNDQEDGIERKVAKKTKKLKKFFGKRVHKIKSEVKVRKDDSSSSDEETPQDSPTPLIKIKSGHGKGPAEFEKLRILQDLSGEHVGAVWTIKFTLCGRLMATAGQDHMVRVWVLKESQSYFEEMRAKYSKSEERSSPNLDAYSEAILERDETVTPTEEGSVDVEEGKVEQPETEEPAAAESTSEEDLGPFMKSPLCTYFGHTGDVLDLSWSKNYFLLSSSMDKTVRLWHISRTECLCCFQHIDFVTAICFHPRDDRYFLSGSLDGKIRLWNIPDKKVALWNEVEGTGSNLITAANFCLNGKFAVVGTYDGRCIFYETERLKYHTQWQVRAVRNKKARGRKISGIEPMPGEDKVLITSNDSRIRLYDLKDNSLYCKYKGCVNISSQIKAGFSHDGQYVVCGSEDHFVYIWRTQHGIPSSRRDKNEFYESFSAHAVVVTAAMFAPVPWLIIPPETDSFQPVTTEVLVTADWSGAIKLFVNR